MEVATQHAVQARNTHKGLGFRVEQDEAADLPAGHSEG